MTAASNIVAVTNGAPTTTSVLIAKIFDRPHRNVIRSIDKLIANRAIDALSVERISYQDSMNREQVAYRIPERESLIAMPFIGGRRAEEGQRILVDAFLAARDEINRLRQMPASPDWQQARIEGQTARRDETDAIKAFVGYAQSQGSRSAGRYYLCITKETNRALFFVQSTVGKDFRGGLSAQQLASVAMAERIVERSLLESMTANTFYKDAYRVAAERVRQFAELIGQSVPGKSRAMLEDAQ
ncbi:MAG: Rha family transcriptional regulator [Candidatus Accumulibacter sp.]|uniref:Rha family transcriptional regulator n=1 Tax=Accumulibacter sp. TaxID=2053492 RepID=UPI001B1FAC59|nr:Rha family transcriptional regulator [Accumulibacter sp.]MBO3702839.1 Rha family transcriptional regulator [Accumulibacter sp.]